MGMYSASGDTTKHFSKRVFHLWFSSMYFLPVIFHPPTLASLTCHLTRTLPIKDCITTPPEGSPWRAWILQHSRSYLNPWRALKTLFSPREGKRQFDSNPMLFVIDSPTIQESQSLKPFCFVFCCFWCGKSFINSKTITKKLLQKRWGLGQSASAFHIHHSRSPGRPTGTEIGCTLFNPNERPS